MEELVESVDFFKLAYLIEIAIVINLAFRELKFHQLDEKLKKEVGLILSQYSGDEITATVPYRKLKSLIDCSVDKDIKDSVEIDSVWKNQFLKYFYNFFIRARSALTIVNISIVLCITLLILITSTYKFDTVSIFIFDTDSKLATFEIESIKDIWTNLFYFFSAMCLLPLLFIRLTTQCEVFLFGIPSGKKFGKVEQLKFELEELHTAMSTNLEFRNEEAEGYNLKPATTNTVINITTNENHSVCNIPTNSEEEY